MFGSKKRGVIVLFAVLFLLIAGIMMTVRFDIIGDYEGIFLLRGTHNRLFDLQDDLFLGDKDRLIFGLEFEPLYDFISRLKYRGQEDAHLHYEWNDRNGNGFVVAHLPGGYQILTCFGRFRGREGRPKGLFVGGGLPYMKNQEGEVTMNETGMAFFNGKEWHHLWCNANEGIVTASNKIVYPHEWKFIGSRVLEATREKVIIKSSHEIDMDGLPLYMDRYAFFKADEPFFVLAIVLRNKSRFEIPYVYLYGDEPWVGDYGSSIGNIGWVKDKLYYYEGRVDTKKYSFVGMWDVGNPVVGGESRNGGMLTGMANFIEWLGDTKPSRVYFSNKEGEFSEESKKVPLSSPNNRVLFLEWGPRFIETNQEQVILMAIGMAGFGPQSAFPVKPVVHLSDEDQAYLRK